MGSVRVIEYSSVGNHSTSLEYEFSDAKDFFEYQDRQQAAISNIFSVNFQDGFSEDDVAEKLKESFTTTAKKKGKGDLH